MKNRNVGILVMSIAVTVFLIVLFFGNVMKQYINTTCPLVHEESNFCPAKTTIRQQTFLASGIAGVIFIIGLYLFFSKPEEKVIVKKEKQKSRAKKKADLSGLESEDKKVFHIIEKNNGIFQADLIERTEWGKTKITRILNRLEDKGLIERKRRGMTNVVVLKN